MDAEFLALVSRVAALEGRLARLEGPHAELAQAGPAEPMPLPEVDAVHKGWRAWVQQHVSRGE